MPSIKELVQKNMERIASGENLVVPASSIPSNPTPPPPITAPNMPVRGTFTLPQMSPTDFTNTTRLFQGGNPRSGAFPYPPNPTPAPVLTPKNIVNPTPVTATPVNTNSSTAGDSIQQQGAVDSTIGVVSQRGSMVPSQSAPFEYSSTSSQILIINVGQLVLRADGNLIRIADSTVTVTGLKAGTTYYAYPYYSEYEEALNYVSSSGSITNLVGTTFNGSTGDVTTTLNQNILTGDSWTIEVWFRTTSGATGMIVEANANHTGAPSTTTHALGIGVNSSGEVFGAPNGSSSTGWNTEAYNDGAWHQAVMTFASGASGNYSGYIDGALIFTLAASTYSGIGTSYWRIANGGFTGSSTFFSGTVGPVALWRGTVLTAAQIAFHFNTMINVSPSAYFSVVSNDGPGNFWLLNETSGTTAADSADSNTGTYTGGYTLNQSQATLIPFGTPSILWESASSNLAQVQAMQGNTPLSNGALVVATTASGSGGGVVSGQQVASCFSGNTLVKTKDGNIQIRNIKMGDKVLTASGKWKRVVRLHQHGYSGLVHDLGNGELVTPSHRILSKGQWVSAENLYKNREWFSIMGTVFNLSVKADDSDNPDSPKSEASYTLANGLVVHNLKNVK